VQAINESGGGGRINSEFSQVPSRTGGYPGMGPLIVEGSLNGGGPKLRVNVMEGTIYLRKLR
jgi:hypothetical protein